MLSGAIAILDTTPAIDAAPLASAIEARCASRLARRSFRLSNGISRRTGECLDAVLRGQQSGPCPGAGDQELIDRRAARILEAVEKHCGSVCSVSSDIACLADHLCPPLPAAGAPEACTAGAANRPFDMGNIGFPGALCPATIGHALTTSEDLADCVESLTRRATQALIANVYGSLGQQATISPQASGCLERLAKRSRRIVGLRFRSAIACHKAVTSGKLLADPGQCTQVAATATGGVAMAEQRLAKTLARRCNDEALAELDLCGNGIGGTTTDAMAVVCLLAAAREIADASAVPALRQFTEVSLVEAAYPPAPACGDNVVNQLPGPFLMRGEECDGSDSLQCPGECLPPGDLFECTCANTARIRHFVDGASTDIDNGWTGTAHDTMLPDGAGYVVELSECDCDDMEGAACVGSSADSVCELRAATAPFCSWNVFGATRCDGHGDWNSVDEDSDCWICDAFSDNAGAGCNDEADCQALCYSASGTASAACPNGQSDCPPGQVCRGQCDRTQECIALPFGAPAPVSSAGTALCIVSTMSADLTGTSDTVTGEHAMAQRQTVKVHLGTNNSLPCPVCGGFCNGGRFGGAVCRGTCSTTREPCRFDSDCPNEESCTSLTPDCPGSSCNLANVCFGGPNNALPCRVEAETPLFGTVSNDCPPNPGQNISGSGLSADYLPITSESVTLASTLACTAPGFELFSCPCPDDGGRRTAPNRCTPACNAGAEFGRGCSDGNNATGTFTTCAGGINAARACDEDSDCPGSTCSDNPTHCTGDPSFDRVLCASNSDCGLGTCVDACPAGRCVPLCVAKIVDPEEGVCAAGPSRYHCSGEAHSFRACTPEEAGGDCQATCSGSGTACQDDAGCDPGSHCEGECLRARLCEAGFDGVLNTNDDWLGAGVCVADATSCFLDPLAAEGGDLLNARGGPVETRSVAVLCLAATGASAVNQVLGLGGPGRARRSGINVTNGFETLP